jgi:hypothetical protein
MSVVAIAAGIGAVTGSLSVVDRVFDRPRLTSSCALIHYDYPKHPTVHDALIFEFENRGRRPLSITTVRVTSEKPPRRIRWNGFWARLRVKLGLPYPVSPTERQIKLCQVEGPPERSFPLRLEPFDGIVWAIPLEPNSVMREMVTKPKAWYELGRGTRRKYKRIEDRRFEPAP